jgi:hypothetical protein
MAVPMEEVTPGATQVIVEIAEKMRDRSSAYPAEKSNRQMGATAKTF